MQLLTTPQATPVMNTSRSNAMSVVTKIPAVAAFFWVMKICATTLGETAGDLFAQTLKLGYAATSAALITIFFAVLALQLRTKRYRPVFYWSVILATSTAGTTMSDFMDRTLGLGYAKGTAILVSILIAILGYWRYSEGSLNVKGAMSRKTELLYWAAILFSNTLGTALGDFLADSSGLGFGGGALLIGTAIALIVVAYYRTNISKIALFWLAFVLTRPLGATVGDLLTKSHAKGGMNLGTIGSSAVLAGVLASCVAIAVRRNRAATPDADGGRARTL
jgi:uncharacterized membrane-anchored protein